MKKSSVALASIAGLILVVFAAEFILDRADGYGRICILQSPVDDARIEISSPNFEELSQALVYEVRAGNQVRIPFTYFASVSFGKAIAQSSFK